MPENPLLPEAQKALNQAAQRGDLEAQYRLGIATQKRVGAASRLVRGQKWLKKAADKGHVLAQVSYARSKLHPKKGMPQDVLESREYYRRAAIRGNREALCGLKEIAKIDPKGFEDFLLDNPEPGVPLLQQWWFENFLRLAKGEKAKKKPKQKKPALAKKPKKKKPKKRKPAYPAGSASAVAAQYRPPKTKVKIIRKKSYPQAIVERIKEKMGV